MRRRELFPLFSGIFAFAPAALSEPAQSTPADPPPADTAFDAATVRNLARALALKPYQAPDSSLPDQLKDLKYSDYQTLRFDKTKALWRGASKFSATAPTCSTSAT